MPFELTFHNSIVVLVGFSFLGCQEHRVPLVRLRPIGLDQRFIEKRWFFLEPRAGLPILKNRVIFGDVIFQQLKGDLVVIETQLRAVAQLHQLQPVRDFVEAVVERPTHNFLSDDLGFGEVFGPEGRRFAGRGFVVRSFAPLQFQFLALHESRVVHSRHVSILGIILCIRSWQKGGESGILVAAKNGFDVYFEEKNFLNINKLVTNH